MLYITAVPSSVRSQVAGLSLYLSLCISQFELSIPTAVLRSICLQVVDDILDFTQTAEQLGKPQGQDLASGNLTAPVIFALQRSPELESIIQCEFTEEDSLQRALELVDSAGGIQAARDLAESEANLARQALKCLRDCPAKRSLELMVDYVLERIY